MKSTYIYLVIAAIIPFSIEAAQTGGDSNSATTTTPAPSGISSETLTPTGTTSTLSQQAGVIQNNSGIGTVGYPNCTGTCIFSNMRVVPNGSSNNIEASIGVVWQISSPESIQAQANKAKIDAEREQLTTQTDLALTEKLAEAIEKKQLERVNAIAIILAKRLGYSDYRKYLQEVYHIDPPTIAH